MSIELRFGLFWSGAKLSYLRYLTFASLRRWHPDADIDLFVSMESNKNVHSWHGEKQDFERDSDDDYMEELSKIGVKVTPIKAIGSSDYCPILQADLFRWIWMRDNGGFYLDTDQIVLRSFETLPLNNEYIYSRYMEPQCGDYCPTGVLGMEKGSNIAQIALNEITQVYSPNNYNSSGPFMLRKAMSKMDLSRSYNTPFHYFYPIHTSNDVVKLYEGRFACNPESYCVHWFGGHPITQEFNKKYTKSFASTSNDWISKYIRESGIT